MHCTKCGFENQDGVTFCSSCGSKFESQQNSRYQGSYNDNQTPISAPEVAAAESNSIASLVLGIISIIVGSATFSFPGIFNVITMSLAITIFIIAMGFFVAGIILGSLAISKGKCARRVLDGSTHNFWIALAGVITGSIGLALSILSTIITFIVFFASL